MKSSEFEDYLAQQRAAGHYDSLGSFTLDFAEAAERLASFRLPSEVHYLLKLVQLASRLGAERVEIKLQAFRTLVTFRAPQSGLVSDLEAITRGFLAPLEVADQPLNDLVGALWGCLSDQTQEVLWSTSQGYRGRRIFLRDATFRAEDFEIDRPLPPGPACAFVFSVLRHKTWRFWTTGRHNASAYRLLSERCAASRLVLSVDGRPLEPAGSRFLVQHRRESPRFGANAFRPYHIILYAMSRPEEGFSLQRPSLSVYVVREQHFNIWASATRVTNTLRPEGYSSPAWLLCFQDLQGQPQSMRLVEKQVPCRLVLAYDEQEAALEQGFRLSLVRHSVLLEAPRLADSALDLSAWHGCHLVLDDDTLPTDLTGFQVIEDHQLAQLLSALTPVVEQAKETLRRGRPLLHGLPPAPVSRPSGSPS